MDKQPEFSLDWPHGWHMRSSPTRVLKYIGKSLDESLVFEVESGDTGSVFTQRNSEGKMVSVSGAKYPDYDIINSPAPKRQWWVNVWEDGTGPNAGKFHSSREEADTSAYISTRQRRLACVCITEGDGL